MKHKPKRSASGGRAGATKRRRKEEDLLPDAADADAFHASDDEPDADLEDEGSGDESADETAEEKKLRLGALCSTVLAACCRLAVSCCLSASDTSHRSQSRRRNAKASVSRAHATMLQQGRTWRSCDKPKQQRAAAARMKPHTMLWLSGCAAMPWR